MEKFLTKVATPVVSVIAALLAAWVNFSVSQKKSEIDAGQLKLQREQQQQQAQLERQKVTISELTAERGVKKIDEDLEFRVYDAVTASLKTNNAKQQQAATALVIVMVPEPLRTQLLHVFGQSETTAPQVREVVDKVLKEEQKFKVDEAAPGSTPSSASASSPSTPKTPESSVWGTWDIDVFWCERSGDAAHRNADSLVTALKTSGAKGRVRARLLPDTINATPGYRLDGYAIRRHGDDSGQAAALKDLAQRTIQGSQFEVVMSGQSFRWYLTAFVCP
jgi:hypothetical protein